MASRDTEARRALEGMLATLAADVAVLPDLTPADGGQDRLDGQGRGFQIVHEGRPIFLNDALGGEVGEIAEYELESVLELIVAETDGEGRAIRTLHEAEDLLDSAIAAVNAAILANRQLGGHTHYLRISDFEKAQTQDRYEAHFYLRMLMTGDSLAGSHD